MVTDSIILPDAPAIAGLSFRHIRGVNDADAVYAIHLGRKEHDQVDPLSTMESLPSREQILATFSQIVAENRSDRSLIAQVDERVVGYSRITSWPEGDKTWVYLTLGWILPEWRGRGIGTAMLHWLEARIRQLAAADGARASPNEKCEFAANASSTEREATALLLNELSQPKHDPTLWQVAWDGKQVAGQVLAVVEQGRAEVFEVSVRPAWRRRGLGHALVSRAVHGLRAHGVDVIRLHTNANFPTRAKDLYQSVGFRVLKEFPRYRKSFSEVS